MLAYRLFSPAPIETRPLVPVDLPLPEPGPGQVRIKVSACGVCHTDVTYVTERVSTIQNQVRAAMDTILSCTADSVQKGVVEEVLTVGNHADGPYLLMRMQAEKNPQAEAVADLLRRSGGNRVGQNIASVNWDGQVFPDQFWRNYGLGSILERPFGDIWQDESDPVLRVLRNKRDYKDPQCARCRWFDLCLGNFRSLSGRADLSDWQNEPPCYLTDDEICP